MRSILNKTEGSKGVSAVAEEVGLGTTSQADGTLWVQALYRDKLYLRASPKVTRRLENRSGQATKGEVQQETIGEFKKMSFYRE